MKSEARIRMVAYLVLLLAVSAAAHAEVRIDVSTGIPDQAGKLTIDVILHGNGENVGGFQNDIVFDERAVHLDSASDCRINPAYGTMPNGTFCHDDPTIGPCKTLNRSLAPYEVTNHSRLRAVLAAIEVLNNNSIPDGVMYTCTFTVVNPDLLPVRLFNTNIVVSDPFGRRLDSGGEDGGACVEEMGQQRCAPLREMDERCTFDLECASSNCDRCCDHQFNGLCNAPRTPTPTAVVPPTRTPVPTRTPFSTRTATLTWTPAATPTWTNTPTPKSPGDPCTSSEECSSNLACNYPSRVCCTSITCPDGMACNVPGLEGYCVRGVPPTPIIDGTVIDVGSAMPDADGFAEVSVSLRARGEFIGGLQNDILFDNTVISLDAGDCRIAPAIGLSPDGADGTSCLDNPFIGPCKNLSKALEQCGTDPLPYICGQSTAPNLSVFRAIVAATAAPNSNQIPDGVLYTCRFRVLDRMRLPVVLHNLNVVVSNPTGQRLSATGTDGRIDPPAPAAGTIGTACERSADCDARNCVDGVCCTDDACVDGESCDVSGERGSCIALRGVGAGCDYGTDCESGNCDLQRNSATSLFRGACGAPRESSTQPGECVRNDDCDSGSCVDGFCCAEDRCPSGQFCNTGECAGPAEPGAPCSADEQCALGLCVDGACCVTGSCPDGESCNVITREGICSEPFRLGSRCTLDAQCPTGFCTDGVCCRSDACPGALVCDGEDPGECAKPAGEDEGPNFPPSGGAKSPTAAVPGAATPTRFVPPPSPSAPARGPFSFEGVGDDGCSVSTHGSTNGPIWPLAFAALLVFARRRAK